MPTSGFSAQDVAERLEETFGRDSNREVVERLKAGPAGYETSYESVRRFRTGKAQTVPHDFLAAAALTYGAPIGWLLTGEGSREGVAPDAPPTPPAEPFSGDDLRRRLDQIDAADVDEFVRILKTETLAAAIRAEAMLEAERAARVRARALEVAEGAAAGRARAIEREAEGAAGRAGVLRRPDPGFVLSELTPEELEAFEVFRRERSRESTDAPPAAPRGSRGSRKGPRRNPPS